MLIQSSAVVGVLLGRDSAGTRRSRSATTVRVPVGAVIAGYWQYTVFGLLLASAAYAVSTPLFLWMTPVLVGLGLAVAVGAANLEPQRGAGPAPGWPVAHAGGSGPAALAPKGARLYRQLGEVEEEDAMHRLIRDPPSGCIISMPASATQSAAKAHHDANLVVGCAKLADADDIEKAWSGLSRAERAAVLGSREGVELALGLARVA